MPLRARERVRSAALAAFVFLTVFAASAQEATTVAEWGEAIHSHVAPLAAAGDFSGAVLVGRRGEPIFVEAWGLADASTGRPITPETPINLGSMNKMFTGLAAAQLEARGALGFDDTVGQHLPDYPNAEVRERVTVHQLLTHTSGIPSYWNAAYEANRSSIETLDEFMATFAEDPLDFAPGSQWGYSNGGPVVLGRIIEVVTGRSYFDYVAESIYAPAGMTRSGHFQKTDAESGIAVGYTALRPEPRPNTVVLGLQGSAAGGGYSTVLDLMRFAHALGEGRLLAPERLERLWNPPRGSAEHPRYGYLWGTGEVAEQRWVGHNGGAPGISADFRYFPESGYVVVVLANLSRAAMPVSEWVVALVAGSQ